MVGIGMGMGWGGSRWGRACGSRFLIWDGLGARWLIYVVRFVDYFDLSSCEFVVSNYLLEAVFQGKEGLGHCCDQRLEAGLWGMGWFGAG